MLSELRYVMGNLGGVVSDDFQDSTFSCLLVAACVGEASLGARFLRFTMFRTSFLVESD